MRRSSWTFFNAVLGGLKKFPLLRWLYKISWAPKAYHFFLAYVGALIYRFPSQKLTVIGVTGTKGKTTTLELVSAMLEAAGKKTALLSSVYVKIGDEREENSSGNTQRGRFFAQFFLREAVREKCKYALLEVTSLGVVHARHRPVTWSIGAITNIAPEHIEAHGSFEKYREAKLRFLQYAAGKGAKIFVNGDDRQSQFFVGKLKKPIIYSKGGILDMPEDVFRNLPGGFNKENAACAVAIARELGVSGENITKTLETFRGVPGRMEYVQKKPFAVVADYAHTPDSLEAVYKTLKQESSGGLICVFGSMGAEGDIGGRDKWKRPELGKIAATHCREIILTDEDPVDEDPAQIVSEIRSGISETEFRVSNVYTILDRKEAIQKAISLAKPGDTVAITGKGSETYIRVKGGKRIPWSDVGVVREVLEKRSVAE